MLIDFIDPATLLNLKKTFPSISPHYKGVETIPGMKFAYVHKENSYIRYRKYRYIQSRPSSENFIYYDVIVMEYDRALANDNVKTSGNYVVDVCDFKGERHLKDGCEASHTEDEIDLYPIVIGDRFCQLEVHNFERGSVYNPLIVPGRRFLTFGSFEKKQSIEVNYIARQLEWKTPEFQVFIDEVNNEPSPGGRTNHITDISCRIHHHTLEWPYPFELFKMWGSGIGGALEIDNQTGEAMYSLPEMIEIAKLMGCEREGIQEASLEDTRETVWRAVFRHIGITCDPVDMEAIQ
jgi:hypothetical protein